MKIPLTWRKKALIIVDVQDWFIVDRNKYIIPKIEKIIKHIEYDLIVSTLAHNKKDSLWIKQIWWEEYLEENDHREKSIVKAIDSKKHIFIEKASRSAFKWDIFLKTILKEQDIKEVHIVWIESNDCVMATALESIDYWFFTFVIEEATETRTTEINHKYALDILRYLKLTNNSKFVWHDKIKFEII